VYDGALVPVLAGVLRNLGSKRCLLVHGEDGLDEITIAAKTQIAELKDGEVQTYTVAPADVGLSEAKMSDLLVSDVQEAAEALRSVLAGEKGPRRDVVLLNAGAAILVAGAAGDLQEGVRKAGETIDSGAAARTLDELVRVSNETVHE